MSGRTKSGGKKGEGRPFEPMLTAKCTLVLCCRGYENYYTYQELTEE